MPAPESEISYDGDDPVRITKTAAQNQTRRRPRQGMEEAARIAEECQFDDPPLSPLVWLWQSRPASRIKAMDDLGSKEVPGLISRKIVTMDEDFAMIREVWDISVAGCPMVRNPWVEPTPDEACATVFERRVLISPEEARAIQSRINQGTGE